MHKLNKEVAVLIATRNRSESLAVLLRRLNLMLDEFTKLVVVDSSDYDEVVRSRISLDQLPEIKARTEWVQTDVKSLTYQRNLGLRRISDCYAVQIFDDDVVPKLGYISKSLQTLVSKDAVGVSGITGDGQLPPKIFWAFELIFGLRAATEGRISPAGIGTAVMRANSGLYRVDWLIGCSMWNLEKISGQRFNEQLKGSALFEDVEFSSKNSASGPLFVDTSNILSHASSQVGRPDKNLYWYRFGRNRKFVLNQVSKHANFQLLRGSLGVLLMLLFSPSTQDRVASIRGLVMGTLAGLTNGEVR